MLSVVIQNTEFGKEDSGYFTLEATIIATITCFLVLCMMVAAVYCYDLSVAAGYLKEKAADFSLESENLTFESQNFYENELEGKLIMARITKCIFYQTNGYIVGQAELTVRFPIPMVSGWIGDVWTNQMKIQIEQGNVTEKIRRWNLLE